MSKEKKKRKRVLVKKLVSTTNRETLKTVREFGGVWKKPILLSE